MLVKFIFSALAYLNAWITAFIGIQMIGKNFSSKLQLGEHVWAVDVFTI